MNSFIHFYVHLGGQRPLLILTLFIVDSNCMDLQHQSSSSVLLTLSLSVFVFSGRIAKPHRATDQLGETDRETERKREREREREGEREEK